MKVFSVASESLPGLEEGEYYSGRYLGQRISFKTEAARRKDPRQEIVVEK